MTPRGSIYRDQPFMVECPRLELGSDSLQRIRACPERTPNNCVLFSTPTQRTQSLSDVGSADATAYWLPDVGSNHGHSD